MFNFILLLVFIYILIWLLPRLFFVFRGVYLIRKKIREQQLNPNFSHHYKNNTSSSRYASGATSNSSHVIAEKDISSRAKIIEEKQGKA